MSVIFWKVAGNKLYTNIHNTLYKHLDIFVQANDNKNLLSLDLGRCSRLIIIKCCGLSYIGTGINFISQDS